MTELSIKLDGDTAALGILNRAEAALSKPRELYDDIGLMMVGSAQENFEREAGPDGSPWPRSIRAQWEGGKTLTDTARLKNSLTHEPSDTGVEIGTNDLRGPILHQGGTITAKTSRGLRFRIGGNGGWVTKQSVTIPARPFLGVGPDDEAEIVKTTQAWLSGAFGGIVDADR